jgi:hypothetical protein
VYDRIINKKNHLLNDWQEEINCANELLSAQRHCEVQPVPSLPCEAPKGRAGISRESNLLFYQILAEIATLHNHSY